MLKNIIVICGVALMLGGTVACNKTNPLANKSEIDNLLYILGKEDNESWPGECEIYYVNPASLRYSRHKEYCSDKSAQIYNKYKNHAAMAGATLDDFRDSKLWEMISMQHPNRSFR